jgi:hypothetical protein
MTDATKVSTNHKDWESIWTQCLDGCLNSYARYLSHIRNNSKLEMWWARNLRDQEDFWVFSIESTSLVLYQEKIQKIPVVRMKISSGFASCQPTFAAINVKGRNFRTESARKLLLVISEDCSKIPTYSTVNEMKSSQN